MFVPGIFFAAAFNFIDLGSRLVVIARDAAVAFFKTT
jgi:hypothetical protein